MNRIIYDFNIQGTTLGYFLKVLSTAFVCNNPELGIDMCETCRAGGENQYVWAKMGHRKWRVLTLLLDAFAPA
jgi:hypothetical protein